MGAGSLTPAWHVLQQAWPSHQGLVGTLKDKRLDPVPQMMATQQTLSNQAGLALHVHKCIQEAHMSLSPWAPPLLCSN